MSRKHISDQKADTANTENVENDIRIRSSLDGDNNGVRRSGDMTQSLVALSTLESITTQSEALTIVNAIIQLETHKTDTQNRTVPSAAAPADEPELQHPPQMLTVPDDYAAHYIPPAPEPREYLTWKFHGMNLLVGSDALIYRSSSPVPTTDPSATTSSLTTTTALAVRVEDASHMQAMLQQHQTMQRNGHFIADHQLEKLQQIGKPSYAQAVARTEVVSNSSGSSRSSGLLQGEMEQPKPLDPTDHPATSGANGHDTTRIQPDPHQGRSNRSFAAPDLDQVRLQTCIVPVTSAEPSSVGSLLSVSSGADCVATPNTSCSSSSSKPLSPVSTVLDTYLDNIMANVPQLALCLREKGFIQSVKLLNTDEIPSRLMQSTTLDTSIPFEMIRVGPSDPADEVFSPQIMEMNAQALLRFLKTNCSKDNATYLLRRDAGRTNIELYDISSISAQRQQKWIWWLAMISYRFSNRLRHLSLHSDSDAALRRSFRVRQRSLLHNTLDLLETLADMNGNRHESLIAAVSENLADTFLVVGGDDEESGIAASGLQTTKLASPIVPPPQAVSSHQPYGSISVDALTKAQDHLLYGIKILGTVLDHILVRKKLTLDMQNKRNTRLSEKTKEESTNSADSSSSTIS